MKEFYIHRFRSDTGQPDTRRTLIRVDDNGLITQADGQAKAILGFGVDELLSRPISHIAAAGQDDLFSPRHRHGFEAGQPVLLTLRHKDGFFFTAQVSLRVDVRDSDQPANAFISLRDSTQMDPRLLTLVENSGQLGVWELDMLTNQITWTEGLYRLLELKPGADITPEQALFYCQNAQARLRALFRRCACTGKAFSIDLDVTTARQHRRRVTIHGRALKTGQRIVRIGGTLVNRSDLQYQEDACRQARLMLQAVMAATDDLVAAVDRDLNLLCFNRSFSQQMELTFGLIPVEGNNLGDLLGDFPNERRLIQQLWSKAFERKSFVVEMPLAQQNRELPVYQVRYQQLLNSNGDVLGAVQVARDITQRVRSNSSRHYLSRHDPVTGLLNRREFTSRLKRLLENRRAAPVSHSLLYLELDNLTDFNQRAGTGACDRYLRELADALNLRVRQRDALARIAGDTFALLIENCYEHEARKVSQTVVERIADFTFEWQSQPLNTTASAGLLLLDEASSGSPDHLLARAAELCLTAKAAGRNRVHTGSTQPENTEQGDGRDLLDQFQRCLDSDGLVLEYQSLSPVASVTWGDHIEVLTRLRMNGANDPLMQPEEFLPIAERFGLTRDIDRQVISKTLTWLAGQSLLEPRLKYCGFNLSLASVLDETFADFMQSALTGLPFLPGCFCMEIRESDATRYPDEVAVFCDAMHQVGCRIALDGAGASVQSYALAASLPVDIIKLDQAMMTRLHDDPVQQVMVEALHKIAEAAGKTTVATFIENGDALRKVRKLGLHYGQGFRLSRPKALAELTPVAVNLHTGRIGG